jgi:hypothetical protein
MNTPQSVDPRDMRTCRACGHVFSRVLGTCPACGALRDYRRKHKKSQRLRDRVDRAWYNTKQTARRYKWYILYIGGGAFIAAIIHPTAMFLAEFSRPPGWRDSRWEAGWSLAHFFEPFVAAGETLWRWITGAVVATVAWIGDGIAWLLMAKPSLVFAAVVGGGIGAVLAWRRTRRHRQRKRHRRHHRRQDIAETSIRPAMPTVQPGTQLPDDDWGIDTAPSATPTLARSTMGADTEGPLASRPSPGGSSTLGAEPVAAESDRRAPPLDPGV